MGATPRAAGGIAQRLQNHMQTLSSFTLNYLPLNGDGSKLRAGYSFKCVVVSSNRLRALLEAYAIGHLCPLHLGLGQVRDG